MHVTELGPSPRYWMPSLSISSSPIAKHANPGQQPNITIAGLSKNYAETISLIEKRYQRPHSINYLFLSAHAHTQASKGFQT